LRGQEAAITPARRGELLLLVGAGVLTLFGALQVCLATATDPARVLRFAVVPGVLVLAAFALDFTGRRRDHLLLPLVGMLCGLSLVSLWRLDAGSALAAEAAAPTPGSALVGEAAPTTSPASTPTVHVTNHAAKQIVWMIVGVFAMLAVYHLLRDVRDLARYKYLSGLLAIGLIVATMVWGIEVNHAKLWLGLKGILTFQPTELAKLLVCVFLAGYVAANREVLNSRAGRFAGFSIPELRHLAPLVVFVFGSLAMFVAQKDLGVLFFGLFAVTFYVATGRKTYVLIAALMFVAGAVAADHLFPAHVERRMAAWLDPWADPHDAGQQILRSLFCFAEGGLVGTGLGGVPLPSGMGAAHTDLIFAVVAHEIGLAGALAVLLLFAMTAYRGYAIAWQSTDPFGALLAGGLATVFALQAMVIVGGTTKLIPLTGITLPFMSYGGTSIVVNFIAIGILLCISRDCGPEPEAPSAPANRNYR